MRKFGVLVVGASALAVLGTQDSASAQQRPGVDVEREFERNETVGTRPRPDFDARGVRTGGFLFNLDADGEVRYDDNVFRRETNTNDDTILVFRPRAGLYSGWSRHAVNVYGDAEIGRFQDFDNNDYEDWTLGTDGRLDFTRSSFLTARIVTNQRHEDRGSPDEVNGINPTTYKLIEGDAAFDYRPTRWGLRLNSESNHFRYDNTATSTGLVNQQDRNRDEHYLSATGSYEIQPAYDAFLRIGYNRRKYDNVPDDEGFNRNSEGWAGVLGARIDLTGVLFGDVFAGYIQQRYEDDAFGDVDGPQVGAALFWNPTGLTSLSFRASRAIQETTLAGASGFWSTTLGAGIDHELRRNILLNGQLTFATNEYNGISRDDELARIGIGGTYLINRHWRASANYSFDRRDSNQAGASFDKNLVILRITARL